jgi:hypothetical protein
MSFAAGDFDQAAHDAAKEAEITNPASRKGA